MGPANRPGGVRPCIPAWNGAESNTEYQIYLSLRYTVGNKAEASQSVSGRIATIKTYDPLLKKNLELTLLTA